MNIGPRLVIQGAILGCVIVAVFTFVVTAGAAPLDESTSRAIASGSQTNASDQAIQDQKSSRAAKDKKKTNANNTCSVSEKFPESIRQWCNLITNAAKDHGLDPDLVAAVMYQESGGQPDAYSKSGAVGLMQVMPRDGIAAKFQCVNGPCFASRPTIEELKNPEFNINYGVRMLAGLQNRLGSLRDGLKSYGPMDMGYRYADIVLNIYENYKD